MFELRKRCSSFLMMIQKQKFVKKKAEIHQIYKFLLIFLFREEKSQDINLNISYEFVKVLFDIRYEYFNPLFILPFRKGA